jgi:hypothetical protein
MTKMKKVKTLSYLLLLPLIIFAPHAKAFGIGCGEGDWACNIELFLTFEAPLVLVPLLALAVIYLVATRKRGSSPGRKNVIRATVALVLLYILSVAFVYGYDEWKNKRFLQQTEKNVLAISWKVFAPTWAPPPMILREQFRPSTERDASDRVVGIKRLTTEMGDEGAGWGGHGWWFEVCQGPAEGLALMDGGGCPSNCANLTNPNVFNNPRDYCILTGVTENGLKTFSVGSEYYPNYFWLTEIDGTLVGLHLRGEDFDSVNIRVTKDDIFHIIDSLRKIPTEEVMNRGLYW